MTYQKQETKNGGPYTKEEQEQRRIKVYDLHFEKGLPAIKIADELGVNRNTISSDLQFLYSTIQNEDDKITLDDLLNKHRERFELQRTRLVQILQSTNSLHEKLQIEKLIFDIDSKLTNTYLKIFYSKLQSWDRGVQYINDWMENNGQKKKFLLASDLVTIPENKMDMITEILKGKNEN